MRKLLTFLFLIGTCFAQTVNNNIYPAQSGLSLGRNGQRWNVYAKNLDITGTVTHNGVPLNNVCYVDGVQNVTLAAAITCAGSSGTIIVPPSGGALTVPGTPTVPAGVTLKVYQGAVLAVSTSLTIAGALEAGAYQIFSGAGTVSFTGNEAVSRPEWWGAKPDGTVNAYPITGTDNLAAFDKALAALPNYPGLPGQAPYQLVDGKFAKIGRILFSLGRYVISSTWVASPFVSYECPSYVGCFIVLKDGVATSGAELWTVNVQALTGPSPNTSYGAQFKNMAVDCNGFNGGTNAKSSGVIFNGAQGSSLGSLWIANCGLRGFWLKSAGSNASGLGGQSDLEVVAVGVGPGAQLDAGFANFNSIRTEVVNQAGTNLDADGDPNPGLLIGSAASNGAVNVNIAIFGAELSALPIKIWSGAGISIQNLTMTTPSGGGTNGIIISHGAAAVSLGPTFTFAAAPNLFTNFVTDRSTTPTTTVAGNLSDFPSILGYHTAGKTFISDVLPIGTSHLGAATTPWADVFIGSASGSTAQMTGTFTGNRVMTFPDASGTICTTATCTGSAGLADPGGNGILKRTALNTTAASVSADVIGLWTGTCNGTKVLMGDGSCAPAAAAGAIKVMSSYANAQTALTAMSAGDIMLVDGTYTLCSGTLAAANVSIRAGNQGGVLQCATANVPVLTISTNGVEVSNLNIKHITNSPTSGGDGIFVNGNLTGVRIHDNLLQLNWYGANLGATSQNYFYNNYVQLNNSDGVRLTPSSGVPVNQWFLTGNVSQKNLGWGYRLELPGAFTSVQVTGPYISGWNQSFGNALGGFAFIASLATTSGIGDIWIDGAFSSQENGTGFYIDSGTNGGRNVVIGNVYAEQAGTYAGPAGFASATQTVTNAGYGIYVTSACDPTPGPVISNGTMWSNSDSGVRTDCAGTQINNISTFKNGTAGSANSYQRAGIAIRASNVSVIGGYHRDSTSKEINGVDISNSADKVMVQVSCDTSVATCVQKTTTPTTSTIILPGSVVTAP